MFLSKNKRAMAVLSFLLVTAAASAANQTPKVTIDEGGFLFFSSHKLRLHHSKVHVKTYLGRISSISESHNGSIYPGRFSMGLHVSMHGKKTSITTSEDKNGHQRLHKEAHISPSSKWRSSFYALLTRLGSKFDPARDKMKKYAILKAPKALLKAKLQSFSNCKLCTRYCLRVADFPKRPSLSKRVVVDTIVEEKTLPGHGDRKVLVAKALFCTKKQVTLRDHLSVVTFKKTKRGIREISKNSIKFPAIWNHSVREVAEKSIERYLEYKKRL